MKPLEFGTSPLIAVRFKPETTKKIKEYCKRMEIPISTLVRMAVVEYMRKLKIDE